MEEGNSEIEDGNKYKDFITKYKAPPVTAKTYSDARKCIFKSFNDNWKAASNVEKNAELFLRSFEFTFSGSGAQDFWEQKDKGNIFKRANHVAREFRKNRARMVTRTDELDKEMTCKCIAIFGPTTFPADKQAFFNNSCEAESAELRAKLGTDVDSARGAGGKQGGESNIDGTSLNSTNDTEGSTARVEEIDKGAAGISHEKLLIEFLGLRAEAQVERFLDDEALEDELNELSTYISETDFEEVWKDRVKNHNIMPNSPEGDSRLLYKWGYKYLKGWVKIFVIILAISIGLFAAWSMSWAYTVLGGLAGGLVGFLVAGLIGSYGASGKPGTEDLKKAKKKKYNFFYNYDGFERWYIGPRYINQDATTEKCSVYAKASACLKSAYRFEPKGMKYLSDIPTVGHFIVDPKLPLFVDKANIKTATMPGYTQNWVEIMNETTNKGVAHLRTTGPKKYKNKGGYKITSKSFMKRDVFEEALQKKYFIPKMGAFKSVVWDQKQQIINAATKYAMCKGFVGNVEDPSCNVQDENLVQAGDLGFGYLFESEVEAKEWALYTYELHYVYSSITKNEYMGYPLLGSDAYFQAVAYNMKLVGSLAAERAQNYGEAVALYQEDWEKRAGNYESLGEAAAGTGSRNIKYREAFFKTFGLLNFNGMTNTEAFDSQVDGSKKSGEFNTSELAALGAGRRQAIRVNKDIEKKEAFNATVGKTAEGARIVAKTRKGLAMLNSPIQAIGRKGGVFGNGKLNKALSDINKKLNTIGNRKFKKRKYESTNSYGNLFKSPSYKGAPKSYGADLEGDNNYDNQLVDQGMSTDDAGKLIKALNDDDAYTKRVDSDSLWKIVSKAYHRNYGRVLMRSGDFIVKEAPTKQSEKDKEKAELRKLMRK
jgi:hypothetical protein